MFKVLRFSEIIYSLPYLFIFLCSLYFFQTAKIQALKKTATKGDKKKKKDVAEEIAKLESEMETKHQTELQKLKVVIIFCLSNCYLLITHLASWFLKESSETQKLSVQLEENLTVSKGESKVTKAQRRRDKKLDQAKERVQLIEEQEKANLLGIRHTETEKIKTILAERNMTFYEIPSDGNW